jgi:hypothetical protein
VRCFIIEILQDRKHGFIQQIIDHGNNDAKCTTMHVNKTMTHVILTCVIDVRRIEMATKSQNGNDVDVSFIRNKNHHSTFS